MASIGVVDRRAALKRRLIEALKQQQPQLWVQLVQQHRQGGAHDSAAHKHGVKALQSSPIKCSFRILVHFLTLDISIGLRHDHRNCHRRR